VSLQQQYQLFFYVQTIDLEHPQHMLLPIFVALIAFNFPKWRLLCLLIVLLLDGIPAEGRFSFFFFWGGGVSTLNLNFFSL
jgi:hypothetical protein